MIEEWRVRVSVKNVYLLSAVYRLWSSIRVKEQETILLSYLGKTITRHPYSKRNYKSYITDRVGNRARTPKL